VVSGAADESDGALARSMIDALLDLPVLFFGGKGGVGKTTLAAACAVAAADLAVRTLLVSTDPAHSTSDMLQEPLGPDPRKVFGSLWAMEIDPGREADQYIAEVKERIADVTAPRLAAEVDRQIDIARLTPGAEEAALFDRFTRLIDGLGRSYDRLVFDTAPLGHTLRLLALPDQLTLWMSGLIGRRKKVNMLGRMWRTVAGAAAGDGPQRSDPVIEALEERRRRFERARNAMTDPTRTAFVFVLLPERLSLLETERAVTVLERYGIPIGGVIVNKVVPNGASTEQQNRLRDVTASFSRFDLYRLPHFEREVLGVDALRRLAGCVERLGGDMRPPSRG
jgi:arsenite-transporting ATPase